MWCWQTCGGPRQTPARGAGRALTREETQSKGRGRVFSTNAESSQTLPEEKMNSDVTPMRLTQTLSRDRSRIYMYNRRL